MNVEVDVKLDKKTFNKINQFPDKFLYRVARQTLDISYEYIPRLTGRLRNSSTAYGVKQHSKLDYSIGSQTSYLRNKPYLCKVLRGYVKRLVEYLANNN